MNKDLVQWVEAFPWQSEEQKEGFLAYIQYIREFGREPVPLVDELPLLFLIQKNHEAAEYWQQTVGDQISILRQEMVAVRDQSHQLMRELDLLRDTIKSQMLLIETMTKHRRGIDDPPIRA